MKASLHHPHLFASDLDASLQFYQEMFGAEIIFDHVMAGARNVMISIGTGKINFYDQPPRGPGPCAVHHLGIETDDLEGLVEHMKSKGVRFRSGIRDLGAWKYVMAGAPDNVLLELFQVGREGHPNDLRERITCLP